jgi:WD40 repeat protein
LLVDRENNILRTYTNLFERRVANFSWTGSVLAAGGKDSKVHLIDTRTRGRPGECAVLRSHDETPTLRSVRGRSARLPETSQKEICGLSWSESGRALAVGSNNNRCCIWDAANLNRPRYVSLA